MSIMGTINNIGQAVHNFGESVRNAVQNKTNQKKALGVALGVIGAAATVASVVALKKGVSIPRIDSKLASNGILAASAILSSMGTVAGGAIYFKATKE